MVDCANRSRRFSAFSPSMAIAELNRQPRCETRVGSKRPNAGSTLKQIGIKPIYCRYLTELNLRLQQDVLPKDKWVTINYLNVNHLKKRNKKDFC